MKVNSSIKRGLYRVFWKTGGSSLAAVGMTADGGRWLAPINWAAPIMVQSPWEEVARLEAIEVPDVDQPLTTAEPACSECKRLRFVNQTLLGACKFLWDQAVLNDFQPQMSWTRCAYDLTAAVIANAETQEKPDDDNG